MLSTARTSATWDFVAVDNDECDELREEVVQVAIVLSNLVMVSIITHTWQGTVLSTIKVTLCIWSYIQTL